MIRWLAGEIFCIALTVVVSVAAMVIVFLVGTDPLAVNVAVIAATSVIVFAWFSFAWRRRKSGNGKGAEK